MAEEVALHECFWQVDVAKLGECDVEKVIVVKVQTSWASSSPSQPSIDTSSDLQLRGMAICL